MIRTRSTDALHRSSRKTRFFGTALLAVVTAAVNVGCGKTAETSDKPVEKVAESAPAAPTVSYEPLLVSDGSVGNAFSVQPLESGNAINYASRAGVMNILEYVVEYPDGTGYVNVEKAYSFGSKYLLIVSTGENGNSCPATTYAIAFDSKTESVTGKEEIAGCSETVESLSDGNKLTVKKEGAASVFYNGEVKQAPRTPAVSADAAPSKGNEEPGKVAAKNVEIKKMMGDVVDDRPNAKPNGANEAKNKQQGKPWQDVDGFVHFPDGSVSDGPID